MSARYGGARRGSYRPPASAGAELPRYVRPARSTRLARLALLGLVLVDVAGLLYLGAGRGLVTYLTKGLL